MFTIHTLPKSIRIERNEPDFISMVETFDFMETAAGGPDRSTTAFVPSHVFAPLIDEDAKTQFVVVILPDGAEPYAEGLAFSPLTYMTHGWHLGQKRVCLAFGLPDIDVEMYVDAQWHVGMLMKVERGDAHLVLAVVCGQKLSLRLLDDALRFDDPDESGLHVCLFSADNFRPHKEYSESELEASLEEAKARHALPYDPSLLSFRPAPLSIRYDE